ncbi:MAG: hypothetical protein ACRYFS_11660 [Janthinobacterium lividum]
MFTNTKELQIALRSLHILEETLTALHEQLTAANPELLAAIALSYTQRITLLQSEVADYFCAHPAGFVARPGG